MIARTLAAKLMEDATHYPIITVTGPRQSGKTTLVRSLFPDYDYLTLEDPDIRGEALSDPRGLLARRRGGVILDEVQNVPELFSYLQGVVDRERQMGRFVLTGSHNFLLLRSVSQTLAGRTAVRHLLPLTLEELQGRPVGPYPPGPPTAETIEAEKPGATWMETVFRGFYPRIHHHGLPAQDWLGSYFQTYLQRDVRELINVGDLEAFRRFVTLCAGRSGQLTNLSALGAETGVSQPTARRWLSLLEASFIVTLLPPFHRSFNKRLLRSPKLYFLDTGLLCYLLRIREPEQLEFHSSRGAIFETFVVSEWMKRAFHRGLEPDLYFWRESGGLEVDMLHDGGDRLLPIEVKAGDTVRPDSLRGLERWRSLAGTPEAEAMLIYTGDMVRFSKNVHILPWFAF